VRIAVVFVYFRLVKRERLHAGLGHFRLPHPTFLDSLSSSGAPGLLLAPYYSNWDSSYGVDQYWKSFNST